MICLNSIIKIIVIGIKATVISRDTTNQNPHFQLNVLCVSPIMYWPIADPKAPVPSMIPMTVVVLFMLFLRAYYFPTSAAQLALTRLFRPLMKNPYKNIEKNIAAILIFSLKKVTK